MKNLNSLWIFLLLLISIFTQAQTWRVSTPYNGRINDIVFVNPQTGYACGQGAGIGNCTASGLMLKTINGGITWTRMNTGTTVELTKIFFTDAFTGWALGATSTVLKTTDGGVNWVQQTFGVGAGLNDIHFADVNNGFICGLNGILRKSMNGGSTFTTIASGVTSTLYGVQFVNLNVGFIIGDNGVIRKSTNGGTSFSNTYSGTDAFRDIWFLNADTGFVLSPFKILKTTNGGNSWNVYTAPSGSILTRIQFVSDRIGFVIGDNGMILKTTDGGDSWNEFDSGNTSFIRSIWFADETTGYSGKDQGQIFKSTDGGTSWNISVSGLSEELISVRFKNPFLGVAVGNFGAIYQTINGGLNWTLRNKQTYPYLNNVRWLTDDIVLAAGADGTFLKSKDRGLNWTTLNIGITDQINDIYVLDSSSIYMTHGAGKLMKSFDAGVTWDTTVNTPGIYPLTGIYFLNKDTGYVCGEMEIYRTYNGGVNWTLKNDSVNQFTTFNDICFTSSDTGYVAGTFGKLYRTFNAGEWWEDVYPGGTSNAEVNEMQFLSNDSGYFAGLISQRITTNAGVNLSTMPTSCLANNWTTHSISMVDKDWGYCVGGLNGLLHTLQKDSLVSTYLQDSIFCEGNRIFVGYLATGMWQNTQLITVQLSDASGSFASPVNIGSFQLYSPMTNPSGIATCTLPAGLNGSGYRIRVICDNPSLIGPDNGYNLTITSSVTPHVNLSMLNAAACANEIVHFIASPNGGGSDPVYTWHLDQQLLAWHSQFISFDTLQGNHVLTVQLNSSLNCAISTATDSLQFTVYPAPVVYAGGDKSVCAGSSVQIGSALNSGELQWNPSAYLSNDTIAVPVATPTFTQIYSVTSTDFHGCKGVDTVLVNVNQLPLIHITGNLTICPGDSSLLTVNTSVINPEISWLPSTGLSSDTGLFVYAIPSANMNVYATVIDDSLCVNTDSVQVEILPTVDIPILAISNGNLAVTNLSQQLEWYQDGILIPGYNNDTLYLPVNGTYQVKSIDANGCYAWSQPVVYSIAGLNQFQENDIELFTSEGVLYIRFPSQHAGSTRIQLFDLSGRLVFNEVVIPEYGVMSKVILPSLVKGMYLIRCISNNEMKTEKILVK